MLSICASVCSMRSRSSPSGKNSQRSRRLVSGVRKSCEIAASICVRSCTKRFSRNCMRLNAASVSATSRGPVSPNGGMAAPRPNCSACCTRSFNGRVMRRNKTTSTAPINSATSNKLKSDPGDQVGGSRSASELKLSQLPSTNSMAPYMRTSRCQSGGGSPLRDRP